MPQHAEISEQVINQLNRKKLVIFDWDGTLVDSVQEIVSSLCYAATQLNLHLAPLEAQQVIGLALPEAMAALFPINPELHQKLIEIYSGHYLANSHTHAFDGVVEMLNRLKGRDIKLAVATGKSRAGLDRVMEPSGLKDYFMITRTASETASKPDPRMLNEILHALHAQPDDAIMIGDSTFDLDMAKNAGIHSVGVAYGVHTLDQLMPSGPLVIVSSVPALSKVLTFIQP